MTVEPRDHYDEVLDLPRSIESEIGLLGGVMGNNTLFESVARVVKAEHFFDPFHRRVFECMTRLADASRMITPHGLVVFLGDYEVGEGVTVAGLLAKMAAEGFVTKAHVMDAARTIKELHDRRRLIDTANQLKAVAYDAPIETQPAQIAAQVIEDLDAIVQAADTTNYRMSVGAALQSTIDAVQAHRDGKEVVGTATGLSALDNALGRLRPGVLVILAGRPGMGKSAVATEIAYNCALRGEVVPFFSLEMPAEDLANRMASSWMIRHRLPAIPYNIIADPRSLNDEQFQRVIEAKYDLDRMPIEIDAQPALSLSQISARARRYKQRAEAHGLKLGPVFVDHIGIMAAPRGAPSREREVAILSGGLKQLAKEIGAPLVVLCQLSRKIEERKIKERRPQLSDLRESGAIEQDADIVLGVYREAYYLAQLEQSGVASDEERQRLHDVTYHLEIGILKNRGGRGGGKAVLRCYMASNRIVDAAEDTQDEFALDREDALI